MPNDFWAKQKVFQENNETLCVKISGNTTLTKRHRVERKKKNPKLPPELGLLITLIVRCQLSAKLLMSVVCQIGEFEASIIS